MRREVRRSQFLTVGSQERTGLLQDHRLIPAYNLICTFPAWILAAWDIYTLVWVGVFPPVCSGTTIKGSWQPSHSLGIAGEDPDPAWESWSSWEGSHVSDFPTACTVHSLGEGWMRAVGGWLSPGSQILVAGGDEGLCLPVLGGWRCPAPRV